VHDAEKERQEVMAGKIKVSEKTVAQLRKGTMAGNLAKAKNASPELKEALVRFYGAKRVNAAMGKSTTSTPVAKSSGPGAKMMPKPKGGPGAKARTSTPSAPKGNKVSVEYNGKRVSADYGTKPITKPKTMAVPAGSVTTRAQAVVAPKPKSVDSGKPKSTKPKAAPKPMRKPTAQEKKTAALRAGGMK
jgi:hypothetical protein